MRTSPFRRPLAVAVCTCLCSCLAGVDTDAGERSTRPIKRLSLDANAEVVALFEAAKAGRVSLKVIALDDAEANVFVGNPGEKPLTVALPKTAAAVHVLGQIGQNPFDLGGPGLLGNDPLGNAGLQAGGNQTIGGGFQPIGDPLFPQAPNGGQFGQFPGNNFFSIPPESVVQLKLHTVCLEHGKGNPRPQNTYLPCPIEHAVESPPLRKLLADHDPETDDRDALQAAAWHLANDKSWRDLARMTVRRGNRDRPLFARRTLARAWELVNAPRDEPSQRTGDTRTATR